jgi:hypothetical protein
MKARKRFIIIIFLIKISEILKVYYLVLRLLINNSLKTNILGFKIASIYLNILIISN